VVLTAARHAVDLARHQAAIDLFLAGIAGRNFTPNYWGRILPLPRPKVVVPMHFDDFFAQVEDEPLTFLPPGPPRVGRRRDRRRQPGGDGRGPAEAHPDRRLNALYGQSRVIHVTGRPVWPNG